MDEDGYVFIEMLKEYLSYMFNSVATSGNETIAQLKRLGMREATDAFQKATVVVQALEYLEQNFSSAALGAHSFAVSVISSSMSLQRCDCSCSLSHICIPRLTIPPRIM